MSTTLNNKIERLIRSYSSHISELRLLQIIIELAYAKGEREMIAEIEAQVDVLIEGHFGVGNNGEETEQ